MKLLTVFSLLTIHAAFGRVSYNIRGKHEDKQHILNGTSAVSGEFPYMAGLRRFEEDIYCGGVLISDQHILTSANCIHSFSLNDISVVLGTHNLLENGQVFSVVKSTISDDFRIGYPYGIGVLKLSRKVQYSRVVQKINLPSTDAPDDTTVVLTGFGYKEKDLVNGYMSEILQKLPVKIVNHEKCVKQLEIYEKIGPSELCGFTAPYYGACYGDSGSPLIYQNTVIGIALSVYPDCAEGNPDLYARITRYLKFIQEAIAT